MHGEHEHCIDSVLHSPKIKQKSLSAEILHQPLVYFYVKATSLLFSLKDLILVAHDSNGTVEYVIIVFINASVYKTLDVNKLRKL